MDLGHPMTAGQGMMTGTGIGHGSLTTGIETVTALDTQKTETAWTGTGHGTRIGVLTGTGQGMKIGPALTTGHAMRTGQGMMTGTDLGLSTTGSVWTATGLGMTTAVGVVLLERVHWLDKEGTRTGAGRRLHLATAVAAGTGHPL